MYRRTFLKLATGGTGLLGLGSVTLGGRNWWMTRRLLIRLGLLHPPANLLRNADFRQCTNPGFPDYWDLPGAAASIQDSRNLLELCQDSPLPSVQAVRLRNPVAEYPLTLESYDAAWDIGSRSPGPYTFSAYLRSEPADLPVGVVLNNRYTTEIRAGSGWQRHHVTAPPTTREENLLVRLRISRPATLYVAAPQLEVGTEPTPFSTALIDDHPLPVWKTGVEAEPSHNPQNLLSPARPGWLTNQVSPFLVTGLYMPLENCPASAWQWQDIRRHGFNTVALSSPSPTGKGLEPLRALLDAAHANGLRAAVFLNHDRGAGFEELAANLVRQMDALKDHPAILCWFLADEPASWWDNPSLGRHRGQLKDLYAAARRADPNRRLIINEVPRGQGPKGIRVPLEAADVGSLDSYPFGTNANGVEAIAACARLLNAACLPAGKQSAFWLQLSGGSGGIGREPTPAEVVAMTYLALIRGCSGLFYWLYKPANPGLWDLWLELKDELARLEELWTRPEACWVSVGQTAAAVHYAVWETGSRSYLLACNARDEAAAAAFPVTQLPSGSCTQAVPWYGGSPVHLQDGQLFAYFEPLERRVIELS
ncbi:MAG: hypothetical protein JO112_07895 [Planctomycetes bacterium]|nr:hypothetical protein [Planctomycetota bacterium]